VTVPGVYSPEQIAAHVERVIASDGVDESRAIEVMARGIARRRWGRSMSEADIEEMLDIYLADARAALNALREMEGE